MFWSDMAIGIVDKSRHVPNVPKLRPPEIVCRIFKQRVYEGGWEATGIENGIMKTDQF